MRKYISVRAGTNENGGTNVDINVIENLNEVRGLGAVGWLDSEDLYDLRTPAVLMASGLGYSGNETLIDKLVDAFEEILTARPEPTVSINGNLFA